MPLYPQKNLIKGFSSYVPNGVTIQQVYGEYKVQAKSTNPTTSNGYWLVDVKPFTNYTFSMERPANMDLGVFNVDASKVVAAYQTVGDVSFNTGANDKIRCYVKGANPDQVYDLKYPMLKEGGSDVFEPYTLGMKSNASRKDIIAPDILGTSHNFVSGNVYKVREDVALTKAKFESLTEGSFNVAIYEWVEGTGKVGNPLFIRDVNVGIGVQTYDFGRVKLKAGKSYFVGRYDQTNAAAIKRITGADIADGKFVKWVGGTTLSQTTIIYPTSYYSFFAAEFEADPLKKAPLLPERNLIPDFNDKRWGKDTKLSGTPTMVADADNPHRGTLTLDVSAQGWLIQIPVKSGKTYTFQFGNITGLYRLLKGWTDSYNNIPIIGQDSKVKTFTPDDTYNGYVTLRLTHGAAGTYRFEDLQMVEGDYSTVQQFSPYNPVKLKPAKLISDKNLLDIDDVDWLKRPGTTYVRREGTRIYWDANQDYAGYQIMLKDLGITDEMLSGKTVTYGGKRDATKSQVLLYYKMADGTNRYIALADYEDYRTFALPFGATEFRFYVQNQIGFRGETWSEGLFMNIVGETTFRRYEPNLKPAILYPKKNIVSLDASLWEAGSISSTGNTFNTNTAVRTSGYIPVNPSTMYYLSVVDTSCKIVVYYYNGDKQFISTPNTFFRGNAFTTPAGCLFMKVVLINDFGESETTLSGLGVRYKFQIEKGSVATAFEQYQLGMKQL